MPRVTFDHADFESAFEGSAKALEPRANIPPVFLYRLLAIGDDNGLCGMTAGFQHDSFYLALDRDDDSSPWAG